jgi:hypothetical protein
VVVRQVRCEVLVGADGVRSRVRQLRDTKKFTLKQAAPNHHQQQQQHQQQGRGDDSPHCPQQWSPTPLTFLGVNVIIGISPARHPLLEKQGFYVLDGQHRLFTMPFRAGGNGTGTDKIMEEGRATTGTATATATAAATAAATATATGGVMITPTTTTTTTATTGGDGQPLHMWQLSFSGWTEREFQERVLLPPDGDDDDGGDDDDDDDDDGAGGGGGDSSTPTTATATATTAQSRGTSSSTNRKRKASAGTTARGLGRRLLREAGRRTAGWMSPVQELISLTRPEDVWGTPLYVLCLCYRSSFLILVCIFVFVSLIIHLLLPPRLYALTPHGKSLTIISPPPSINHTSIDTKLT